MAAAKGYTNMHAKSTRRNIVRLTDLAPKIDVKGGAGRVVFGADSLSASDTTQSAGAREDAAAGTKRKGKDLAPQKPGGKLVR
jgi:hypothetical protein